MRKERAEGWLPGSVFTPLLPLLGVSGAEAGRGMLQVLISQRLQFSLAPIW